MLFFSCAFSHTDSLMAVFLFWHSSTQKNKNSERNTGGNVHPNAKKRTLDVCRVIKLLLLLHFSETNISRTMQSDTLACHSSIGADRRCQTTEAQQAASTSGSIPFSSLLPPSKSPGGEAGQPRWDATHTVGLCHSWGNLRTCKGTARTSGQPLPPWGFYLTLLVRK